MRTKESRNPILYHRDLGLNTSVEIWAFEKLKNFSI